MKKLIIFFLFIGPACIMAQSIDTIIMKDGSRIPCQVILEGDIELVFYKILPDGVLSNKKSKANNNKIEKVIYQVERLEYSDTISIKGKNQEKIYDNLKNWFADSEENLNRKIDLNKNFNKKLVSENKSSNEIKGSFSIPYFSGFTTAEYLRINGTISFNINIIIKDEKCILVFSDYFHRGNEYAIGGAISLRTLTERIFGRYVFDEKSESWFVTEWTEVKKTAISQTKEILKELREIVNKLPASNK
ncbi:MAG TPA: DUF4468 domain-containing protein [Candidatus Paceibacterota bacterium]|nr:DUF4468 domain-containing protein [Candidatus Paceibacterota bacterium]